MVENTLVRSPINGIVSVRPANAGDVVSPGTLLFNIVDPSSMRLMASVPS
jgi:multidrug resistance efflux pump